MTALRALAPGKVNLALFLGPVRDDGLHELVSLVESLSLADELTLEQLPGAALVAAAPGGSGGACDAGLDEIVCAGVEGPNLAGAALGAFRAASGWDGPPQRLTIAKRVPVAAGMGGGSGDAAAALRLAAHAAGRPGDDPLLARLAPQLGADVPSQLRPGLTLVGGAGERVRPLPALAPHGVLIVPSSERLATADVYREADRLALARPPEALAERQAALLAALGGAAAPAAGKPPRAAGSASVPAGAPLPADLLVNDLEAAARSLCPAIDRALAAAREAGADHALVSGSGPTVAGIFWGADGEARAERAAQALRAQFPGVAAARPVGAGFAAIREVRDNLAPR
jgi:4-diphosphocytidyl-2-C-methyl-D-erythritol kinase